MHADADTKKESIHGTGVKGLSLSIHSQAKKIICQHLWKFFNWTKGSVALWCEYKSHMIDSF